MAHDHHSNTLRVIDHQESIVAMSLKKQFFDAFAERPRPSATQIIRAGVSLYNEDDLRHLLATQDLNKITDYELRTIVEGNLWMLTPQAFLYFLPVFLHGSLASYSSVSVFASELIGALTEPSRAEVEEGLNRMDQFSSELGLPGDMTELLRKQQLEWFDSGTPSAIFVERFHDLTDKEGAAILAFLIAFKEAHGADFPFNELEIAINGYWIRYG